MLPLAAIAGTGEAESAEYVAHRKMIEAQHGENDDGTETHYLRQHGDRSEYVENYAPITDDDSVAYLLDYGCVQRDVNILESYDCRTIRQARNAVNRGEIPTWRNCGMVLENRVRAAIAKLDGERK